MIPFFEVFYVPCGPSMMWHPLNWNLTRFIVWQNRYKILVFPTYIQSVLPETNRPHSTYVIRIIVPLGNYLISKFIRLDIYCQWCTVKEVPENPPTSLTDLNVFVISLVFYLEIMCSPECWNYQKNHYNFVLVVNFSASL